MKTCGRLRLITILSWFFLTTSLLVTKPKVEFHTAVPIPAKPAVALPQPADGHLGGPARNYTNLPQLPKHCKRLDACFLKVDSKDKLQSTAMFKACIKRFCDEVHFSALVDDYDGSPPKQSAKRGTLCEDAGHEQAWDIISQAQAELKTTAALTSQLVGPPISLAALTSQRPDVYGMVLQALFAESFAVVLRSESCQEANSTLTSKARASSAAVPVPAKPAIPLPEPHGHPQGPATSRKAQPMRCKKLDMCFLVFGESSAGFRACIERFCAKLSAKSLSEPEHGALCENKGKKAWEILSKAHTEAESQPSDTRKASLVDLGSYMYYLEVLQTLFDEGTSTTQMKDACRA